MTDVAIRVEGLSKQFQLGQGGQRYNTFRDSVTQWATAPFRWFRRIGQPKAETKTFWALDGVSFDVKPGEVVGVIGRNGAGKSTLLKILSRITDPTHGFAEIHGRIGSLLEVGTGFHPELTGGENIYLNGAILGMRKVEIARKFDEIVAFAEVEKFIDTPVKYYSSGMYLRLAFAVAAHLEPEILLVDEVLAVGDAAFQQKCLGKMSDVSRQGRTVLFVSHNMAAVQELCSRALLLRGGKLAFDGRPAECIVQYTSDMKDRTIDVSRGSAPLVLGTLQVTNMDGGEELITGKPFRLRIAVGGRQVVNPYVFFIMEDAAGQSMLHCKVPSRDIGLEVIDGTCELELDVPALWLTPGVYCVYIKFIVSSLGMSSRVLSDRVMLEIMSEDRAKGTFATTGEVVTPLSPRVRWSFKRAAEESVAKTLRAS